MFLLIGKMENRNVIKRNEQMIINADSSFPRYHREL